MEDKVRMYVEEAPYQEAVQPPVQPPEQLEIGRTRRQVMLPRQLADYDLT